MSDGDEAKPDDDDENILKLDTKSTESDMHGGQTQTDSENLVLLSGLDTQVDNQTGLLDMQGERLVRQESKNINLLDF